MDMKSSKQSKCLLKKYCNKQGSFNLQYHFMFVYKIRDSVLIGQRAETHNMSELSISSEHIQRTDELLTLITLA